MSRENERVEWHKAKINGKVVGKYELFFRDDIRLIEMGSLKIFPEYRGRGYGTAIINHLKRKYIKDYNLLYCFVDKDNEGAVRLYRCIGRVSNTVNNNGQYYVEFFKKDDPDEPGEGEG